MRQLKNRTFWKVLAEYLRNGSTGFRQTYVSLGNHITQFLKLKDWRQVIHSWHGIQFMRECCAKNPDLWKEKWNFLKISK